MRSKLLKILVARVALFTSVITWAAPGYALRQTGLEESPKERKRLEVALLGTGNPGQDLKNLGAAANRLATDLGFLPAAGLEEGSLGLDDLIKQAGAGSEDERSRAIQALGRFFSGITVDRKRLASFDGGRRVLPDLTPVTSIGALGVVLSNMVGSGDKIGCDSASSSRMNPAVQVVFRVAGHNWWNRAGEGKREGVPDEAQIPPMEKPLVFSAGWVTLYTANDPVDGTTRTSKGQDGGVTLFMVTPDFGRRIPDELRLENVIYAGQKADFSLKRQKFDEIVRRIAASNRKSPSDYEVWVLNRPHGQEIIDLARKAGAKVRLYQDGTVQPSLYLAAFPERNIIVAGRVGATEGKMVAAPLRNVHYPGGGRVWMKARIISENSAYEVAEKRQGGIVYYEPRLDPDGKKVAAKSLTNGNKLSLKDKEALKEAGYAEEEVARIEDGNWELELEDLAPAAGDLSLSYITEPMTGLDGQPLFDWEAEIHGVQKAEGVVSHTLDFAADGIWLVTHRYPDAGLGRIAAQLHEQERVVNLLRKIVFEDPSHNLRQAAQAALREYLPHALGLDFQRRAGLAIAGVAAGLEEAKPVIGYQPKLTLEQNLKAQALFGMGTGSGVTKVDVKYQIRNTAGDPAAFSRLFGELLALSQGDMNKLARIFEEAVQADYVSEEQLAAALQRLAADPGVPYNQPPVSYYNPARYVYARLRNMRGGRMTGWVDAVLEPVAVRVRRHASGKDLSDVRQKAQVVQALQKSWGSGRQEAGSNLPTGPFRYEIFWDSLVEKDGEYYLTLELLLDGGKDYAQGVVLELQVVIPAEGELQQYQNPYTLEIPPDRRAPFSYGLLDSLHFVNTRFPEWRPTAQRDIYDARMKAMQETGVKRQILRPSVRQGNNPRFFEPFFRAYLAGRVPLIYHIVHTRSEREYGNQGGVPSIGNLASAIVRRGGLGVTASWLIENPKEAEPLVGQELVFSYELDHHRIDNVKDAAGFAADFEYLVKAYQEALVTGWVSANLQDETKLENVENRQSWLRSGVNAAQTNGMVDATIFQRLEEVYSDAPVAPGLPSSLGFHWVRNRILRHLVETVGVPAGGVPYDRWYIEPDYALDGKPHTVEEMAYLSFMSWMSAQAHGFPLGPVVPSYGNVHGASAGNPSLALAGVHQYAAQAATLYGQPLPPELLAISRKTPRGYSDLVTSVVVNFKDQALAQEIVKLFPADGQRTAAEEERMRNFALEQLRNIPAGVLGTLKQAELAILEEVGLAKKEARDPRPLEESSPEVARRLKEITTQMDGKIQAMDLRRRAAITTHAASGLSAAQLKAAREAGIWIANKSTEPQNIVLRVLSLFDKISSDEVAGLDALAKLPGAVEIWKAHTHGMPAHQREELAGRMAALYQQMYDGVVERAVKAAKTPEEARKIQLVTKSYGRVFPWFWDPQAGWSMNEPGLSDWTSEFDWLTSTHGRYMFALRNPDGTLRFPNALTWGLDPLVVEISQHLIEQTIPFYHRPDVMNAEGAAQEYRDFMAAKTTAGAPAEADHWTDKPQGPKLDDAGLEESNIAKAKGLGSIFCFDFLENISDGLIEAAIQGGATEFTMNPYSTGNYIQHLLTLATDAGRQKAEALQGIQTTEQWTGFKKEVTDLVKAKDKIGLALKAAIEPSPDVKPETELALAKAVAQAMLAEAGVVKGMMEQLSREGKSGEEAYWVITKYFAGKIARRLKPIFDGSQEKTGYVSIEVDPRIEREDFAESRMEPGAARDRTTRHLWMADRMQTETRDLAGIASNILVKVPDTEAGIATVGVVDANYNVTLAFVDDDGRDAIAAFEKRGDLAHRLRVSPFASRNAVYFEEFWGDLMKEADGSQVIDGHACTIANLFDVFEALGSYADGAIWSSLGMKVKGDPGELYARYVVGVGILNAPPETARDFNRASFEIRRWLGEKSLVEILTDYFQAVKEGKVPSATAKFPALMDGSISPEDLARQAVGKWHALRSRPVYQGRLTQVLERVKQLELAAQKPRPFTREALAIVQARLASGEMITEKELMRVVLKKEGEEKFIAPFAGAIKALDAAMQQMKSGLEETAVREALREFNALSEILRVRQGHVTGRGRPILVNLSGPDGPRLIAVAQALALIRAKNDSLNEIDFRVVAPESLVENLLDGLKGINPEAVSYWLFPRVISYDDSAPAKQKAAYQDARKEALRQLGVRAAFKEIREFTKDLALELRGYFQGGGLRFATEEAFRRFEALLKAA
ncbi:MAG: fructose-bisphosphatase class II [Candidatus Omnitrophica bacterium]|nr:fructose-bisphosphatase class II [Candidatus Omnitrophota bacterium]